MDKDIAIKNLKEQVVQKLNHTLDSPTDFDHLALQIKQVTGEEISSTTLKRLFGYIPSEGNTRNSTLSIITRYLGYSGWSNFLNDQDNYSAFISKKMVVSNDLHAGNVVEVEWRPNRKVVFAALGDGRCIVSDSKNSSLEVGDELEVLLFVLNQPLQVKNVKRNGVDIGPYIAGMDGGLTKLLVQK